MKGGTRSRRFPNRIRDFRETHKKPMQDLTNSAMLICAIFASLAFGVLAAYSLCRGAFALLRAHASSVSQSRLQKASATS